MKCPNCGKEFERRHGNQKYCCYKCGVLKWRRDNPERMKEIRRQCYLAHCTEYNLARKRLRVLGTSRKGG